MISTLPLVTWVKTLVVSSIVPTLILFELQAPERSTLLKETDYIFPFRRHLLNLIYDSWIGSLSVCRISSLSNIIFLQTEEGFVKSFYQVFSLFDRIVRRLANHLVASPDRDSGNKRNLFHS